MKEIENKGIVAHDWVRKTFLPGEGIQMFFPPSSLAPKVVVRRCQQRAWYTRLKIHCVSIIEGSACFTLITFDRYNRGA